MNNYSVPKQQSLENAVFWGTFWALCLFSLIPFILSFLFFIVLAFKGMR